jgi:ABC-type transport system involved in multi-copper enzyme maturation permease subunit
MEISKTLSPIARITKYTLVDEMRHKSFIIMFVVCAICVLLIRGCYDGNYMVNGQNLDAETVVRALSKVTFHIIASGVMVIAALLSMQLFRRDRHEGMQASVLSKPIARWQYVMGKIAGLWVLSVLFMFILHGIVFLITSINLKAFMPGYLVASLLCSINLLFVVIVVLLLSLLMPDIVAFLCVLGHSQMAQALIPQSGAPSQSDLSWWKVVYFLWPKLLGVQQSASSLIESESFQGFGPTYPLINVLLYCLILGAQIFKSFRNEDIV